MFVDEGFTPQLIAEALPTDRPLTVVTASLAVATVLADAEKTAVLLLGGRLRGSTMATVDHWATRMLADFVIDLAYVGANGISRQYGLTTPDPAVGEVKAQAMRSASHTSSSLSSSPTRTLSRTVPPNRNASWNTIVRAPSASATVPCEGRTSPAISSTMVVFPDPVAPTKAVTDPALILTSGAHRVDTAKVAAHIGVDKLTRARPEFVRQHTGQVIGGVSPIDHPAPVPTWIDSWLRNHQVVWAAAGHPAAVFSTTFDELVAMTGAVEIEVE